MKPGLAASLSPIFLLATIVGYGQQPLSPLAAFSHEWNDAHYQQANTASKASYLAPAEKRTIYVLNLIRMNPPLFAKSVLLNAAKNSAVITDEYSGEFKSLVDTLLKMKPLAVLKPDSLAWVSARCHALTSGQKGYVGHTRLTDACEKLEHYYAECCHYGYTDPIKILISLLVDRGVPSLGHRYACLGNYERLGVSIMPHATYDSNTVLDFL